VIAWTGRVAAFLYIAFFVSVPDRPIRVPRHCLVLLSSGTGLNR
jgi:hypothetical protein